MNTAVQQSFLAFHPVDDDSLRRSVQARQGRAISPDLLAILREKNHELSPSPERERAIDTLGTPNVTCVITGQQVGLFGGPLLTYYKALTTVVLARKLSALSGSKVVPVFWLQAEDHDRDEANLAKILGAKGELITLQTSTAGFPERVPLHYLRLGAGIGEPLNTLRTDIGHHPHAESILSVLESSYSETRTFPEAFAQLFSKLFADDGLVFFNPRWASHLPESRGVFQRAYTLRSEIETALVERSAALELAGLPPQVHVRERSPLFFYSPSCDSCVENARVRLEEREDEFHFVGVSGSVSRQTIVAALEREPERFTSSALLRPILQESLFPCAAYVGGEAEVRYFAQVSALPPLFDLPELCIVPRASFILLEPRIVALLGELGLSTEQIRLPESALFEALAAQGGLSSPDALRDAFIEQVRLPFSELADKFAAADKTLRQPVEKAEAKLREQVAGLFERYRLALGRLDGVRTDRLRKVLNNLRPEGKEQERVLSLPYYLARYGPLFRTALEQNVDIPAMQQKEISL